MPRLYGVPVRALVERSTTGKQNRIYLKCGWAEGVPAKCKAVLGARPLYDSAGKFKYWSYPLDFGTCQELRRVWGDALEIGPNLFEWAALERDKRKRQQSILTANFVDCPRIRTQEPKLWAAMRNRPFQTVAAAFAAFTRAALIGDDPGLGKTLETFGAVVESGITSGPILVFCPSTAIESTWTSAVWDWMPEDDVIPITGTRAQREAGFRELAEVASTTGRRTWVLCNIEMIRIKFHAHCPGNPKDSADACDGEFEYCQWKKRHKVTVDERWKTLFDQQWQAVVIDESHEALVTVKSRKAKQSQQRAGFSLLPMAPGGLRLALSGTPWRGKAKNFWGTLNWLRPDLYSGYWRWAEKFFDIDDNNYGRKVLDVRPEREVEWKAMLDTVMIRRTKAEVAKDLPPKLYVGEHLIPGDDSSPIGVWIPMVPRQKKTYDAFMNNAFAHLEGGTLFGRGLLAKMTRLQQFANACARLGPDDNLIQELPSNKFNWLLQFLAERGITDGEAGDAKVVIASRSTPLLELFQAGMEQKGIRSHILTGKTPKSKRAEQIVDFQRKGGPRVFFLNKFAGGVSITLDAADDLVQTERFWVPDNDTQVEDRIHRISRMHQCRIYYLGSEGTIDEAVALSSGKYDSIQRYLLDGLRGVEFAKQLLSYSARG